jgi:hypothetical protein
MSDVVIKYNIAAIFPSFRTRIVDDEVFEKNGKFVSGEKGDALFLKIERI